MQIHIVTCNYDGIVMTRWWALLVYCLLSQCRPCRVAGQASSSQCGEDQWDSAAHVAFEYFSEQVRPKWTTLTGERNFSAVDDKANADFARTLVNSKQQCFVEFVYRFKRNKVRIGRWYKVRIWIRVQPLLSSTPHRRRMAPVTTSRAGQRLFMLSSII